MKLKNKKTGEIIDDGYVRETHDFQFDGQKHVLAVFKGNGHRPPERVSGAYTSLAELCEEWADYEEPKEYWHIVSMCAGIQKKQNTDNGEDSFNKEIGNYFETAEEAEKAVEKLKAWKRLKDKGAGFVFVKSQGICGNGCRYRIELCTDASTLTDDNARADLDLLFGGEA